jgi:MSHA pilin protein MshA
MNKQQSGFTLIELIMVIVVLGALAVTVLPKYVNLQTDAQNGAAQGVAGSLAAASAINFAACKAGNAACVNTLVNCDDLSTLLVGGAMPTGWEVTPGTALVSGSSVACEVRGDGTPGNPPNTVTAGFAGLAP